VSVAKAAVVGAGTMGRDIAKVLAGAGVEVLLKDVDPALVEVDEEGVTGITSYDGFGDVEFVIEAVPEVMELKQQVFAELDAATPGHAILASNTSSLSITEMGEATVRPDKVVGFHFFYPAAMMRLIEVVEGADTSDETVRATTAFVQQIRKTPITCGEAPGFVVNRILNSATSEVWRMVDEQGISYEEADAAIKDSGVAPVGPFHLVDLLGLDTVLHVAEHLHDSYGDRFYVSESMRRLVADGHLGVKTGKGFYEHG
jgi:3-hydroxyacyl-CoA dehydrogenase